MPQAPFYAMARGWLDHPVFGNRKREPFCRAAAWAWMIGEACYEAKSVRIAGKVVELQRGQFSHSLRFMAQAWGWQHDRCRRFVAELSHHSMIATETATGQLVITICNYNKYQLTTKTSATSRASAVRQHCDSTATDLNKETNLPPTSSLRSEVRPQGGKSANQEFEEFWSECPRKVGKDGAARKYLVARKSAAAETLIEGMRRYAASVSTAEKQFIVHPATWLHQGRWKDEPGPDPPVNGHDRPTGPAPSPEELWPELRITH